MFSRRLTQARESKGWSKAELLRRVERTGRSNATGWEQGVLPDADTICRLAVALEVTIDWLFGVDLVRTADPDVPVDLAQAVSAPRVLWSGEPVASDAHARTRAVLLALLAPIDQLREISDYPQGFAQGATAPDANHIRTGAQPIADDLPKRPTQKRRRRAGGAGEPVDGGGQ